MKLNELDDMTDLDPTQPLPWNMVDDLIVFMQNENSFYRRKLYPMLLKTQETVQNGGKVNKKEFVPIIDAAINAYVKKFDLNRRTEDMMSPAEKMECIDKLLTDEKANFSKGEY
jgi:hypothetical protein